MSELRPADAHNQPASKVKGTELVYAHQPIEHRVDRVEVSVEGLHCVKPSRQEEKSIRLAGTRTITEV